ncbi:MAG: DUF4364 family protein [Oscillospiraceae bacterium]|nr:DUF4364 family protein [Oscillospiraceae bacterium]
MDEVGFVFSPLDLKLLILFVLRRLPAEVSTDSLLNLCRTAGVVNYFDFTACLDELSSNGQIQEKNGMCEVTKRGARNAETLESSLPYSVRQRAEKAAAAEAATLSRQQCITASHTHEDGFCRTELSLSDGVSELIRLRLLCTDEQQAERIEKNFRNHAEETYQKLISALSE